jgi:hypothetical protein
MKELLSNIAIFLGSFVGILNISDLLLSKKTKAVIKDKTASIWFYLSEWSKIDLVDTLYKKKILLIPFLLFHSALLLLLFFSPGGDQLFAGFFISSALIVFSFPRLVKWMTPTSKYDFYFFTFVLVYLIDLIRQFFSDPLASGFFLAIILASRVFFFFGILWLTTIFSLKYLLLVLALITLRLTEHEKGPVLGLSTFLVAIGAMLKFFI